MKRIMTAGFTLAIAAAGLTLSTGTAAAEETGTIYGQDECRRIAKMYKDMGYNARCNHIHGDKYYVYYSKPRAGQLPSTGSFGS